MKLSLAVTLAVVATSALAVPLLKERGEAVGRDGEGSFYRASWAVEDKRSEVVESREEGAIKYPTWTKEDKRTDDAHWAGANWALEEKRTTEGHALAHQWGYEDWRDKEANVPTNHKAWVLDQKRSEVVGRGGEEALYDLSGWAQEGEWYVVT
ncbi:hypothetical protein GGF50DRAFT_116649 [Schizophyllum commune]